jgi:hypothetical protein
VAPTLGLTGEEEVTWAGLGGTLRPCGSLGPAYGERGGVRCLGTDEAAENRGGCGGDNLPEGGSGGVVDKMNGRVLFYSCEHRD